MKRSLTLILASALFSLAASASDYSYTCKQRTDRTPVDPKVGKISVTVTHLKNIGSATEYRGEYYDSIDKVKVVVKATKNGQTSVLKDVVTTGFSADVMFAIMDHNNLGVSFSLYMDELEESDVTLKLNGKKTTVSLDCK